MSPRLYLLALLGAAVAGPAHAVVTLDYSLYTLGNYTEQGGSRIGGGVAVAGDARINSVSIGSNLGADRNGTPVVAVGGTVSYDNSVLSHGNVTYGVANTSGRYTQAKTPGGTFAQGTAIDFAGTSAGLLGLSAGYGAMAPTGSLMTQWGAGTLTGGSGVGTDVYTLTTAQLGGVYALRLVGSVGSKAIINVTGASFGSYFSFDKGNYAVSDVVFNFVDATSIGLNGLNLAGSILAPLASLSQQGGRIGGSMVVRNYTSGGANIDGNGQFAYANPPGAVPEPANWVMMIAGFGLIGGAMRRRRLVAA
jgi:choice-of-anchor A domain-containing protein